jgi:hypothetical protein
MKPNAGAANGVLECPLKNQLNHILNDLLKNLAPGMVVIPPPGALKSLIVTECYVRKDAIYLGFLMVPIDPRQLA